MRKLLFVATCIASPAFAQRDTAAVPLNAVVVTADRSRSVLSSSTASVSRITVADLAQTPRATIADALRRVPGFALVDFDGLGFDPQLMVRGFYGGGEAEYVVVLVDGRPISQMQNGIVPWAALPPLSAVESIEIVRGSSSALYGDAAIGGVINIITRRAVARGPLRLDLSGSSYGGWMGNASAVAKDASFWAGGERTDGYRDHAERSDVRGGATIPLTHGATKLTASIGAHRQSFDEPGALLSSLLDANRRASDPLFSLDHTKDTRTNVGINAERGRWSGYVDGEMRKTDATRTLALAPGFGDTKNRETNNTRGRGFMQYERSGFVVGGDVALSNVDSKYYDVVSGDGDAHATSSGERGDLVASGKGSRVNGALFAQYAFEPTSRVRLSLGARMDWLSDDFEPRTPSTGDKLSASHSAFSPKLGANFRYLQTARSSGNFYVTASGSFKAPTLDQLFDQRPIPVPFPPFSLTTSNALLNPQRGGNVEAGLYHTASLGGTLVGSLTLSGYQMDMRDEVDFDVATLTYVNIGKSRHRGIESGISLSKPGRATAYANYTLQKATFKIGDNEGKQLKAIPRNNITVGATVSPLHAFEAGVLVTHSSDAFIDDANTVPLDAFTRVDARVAYAFTNASVFVEVRNLLDKKYNSLGFFDPSGSGEVYFYPAAARSVSAGIRRGW